MDPAAKREEADRWPHIIQKMGAADETMYDQLMLAKEKGVLDVLHRVIEDDHGRTSPTDEPPLWNRPLHVIIMSSFRALCEVVADLAEARSLADVSRALAADDRPMFMGVLLIATSLIAMIFINMT